MNDLALKLQSEASLDLTTIEAEIKTSPDLTATVAKMKAELNTMSQKASALSKGILDASAFENSFYNNPDTSTLQTLKTKLDNVFASAKELDSERTAYLTDVQKLQQGIGKTALAIETKKSLGSLANAPQELAYLSAISNSSISLEENISRSFEDATARSQTLTDNLDTRIKRNNSYQVLYGQDNKIIEKTQYQSLSTLAEFILAEENSDLWKNQEEVSTLRENWQKATAYFKNGNFETAMTFAEKAKKSALVVFEAGYAEETPIINTDLLVTAAVIIIAFLIIIVILRNRGKFASLVSGNTEDEKFEFKE